jgi:hypothetical protein
MRRGESVSDRTVRDPLRGSRKSCPGSGRIEKLGAKASLTRTIYSWSRWVRFSACRSYDESYRRAVARSVRAMSARCESTSVLADDELFGDWHESNGLRKGRGGIVAVGRQRSSRGIPPALSLGPQHPRDRYSSALRSRTRTVPACSRVPSPPSGNCTRHPVQRAATARSWGATSLPSG